MELAALAPGEARIFLTRHGKTLFNEAHRAQGWCDAPLTENGALAAKQLGEMLLRAGIHFSTAWTGDLGRQRETARLILAAMGQTALPLQTENGLKEVCFGKWEGEKESDRDAAFTALLGDHPYRRGMRAMTEAYVQTDTTGLAEDYDTVCRRITAALEHIGQEALASGGGNVLAVTSGMISMAYFFEVCGLGHDAAPNGLPNACVSTILVTPSGLKVELPIGRTDFGL